MKRQLFDKLQEWKRNPDRKPLVLNGIRQCGKTYLLKEFGANEFSEVHYFNFEKNKSLNKVFSGDLVPNDLIIELSFIINKDIDTKKHLVIFDEIQNCPNAITSLKYFCEDMPELHICAAGSLIGLVLNDASFPVGKVNTYRLYPMSYMEFLFALGEKKLYELLVSLKKNSRIPESAHTRLWYNMKLYWIVGGMPEVVKTFCSHKNNLFLALDKAREKQHELINNYYSDIAKHAGKVNAMHINRVLESVPMQLSKNQDGSAKKFKFKGIVDGVNRYSRLANAIDWLEAAGLIIKLSIINNAQSPLSAFKEEGKFKIFMCDTGLLGAMSDMPVKTILDYDFGTFKGYYAENFVAQELQAAKIYSWQDNKSEVEFVCEIENNILPIEVKSGWVTKAKSLDKFSSKYKPKYSTIMSGHNLQIDPKNNIHRYPLYLASAFPLE